MPLINFGSICNFAEELESLDEAFYIEALNNNECSRYHDTFAQFIKDCKKNKKDIQRTRRENVTEMIRQSRQRNTKPRLPLTE